jgi:predicted Zn-dependent peptidase
LITHRLHNGLRVVMEKIPTFRSVAFGIWVKTGSRSEQLHENGISHFIEHMLFKGTSRYSAKDIADIFDGIGGNVNAFTSKEYTCYYAKVLDEHLPIAVEVLADMFFNSTFEQDELEKEKNVIYEEISMYDDTPDDTVHDLIAKASYGDHPLGYTILGSETNLAVMTSDHLRQYMKRNYSIPNTVISIAGNIDDNVLHLVEQHFGTFANDGVSQNFDEPVFMSEQKFQSKKTEQNHICLTLPGLQLEHKLLYPMILLNNVIGGGMSSRLFQEIREKRGLAYSVYSYHSAHIDTGVFTLYAGTAPKQSKEVLKVTMELLQEIQHKGITEVELKRGKEQLKGSLILSLESTSSRMSRLGKNELMIGKHFTLDEMIARIDDVRMDHIAEVMKGLFSKPFATAMVGEQDDALQDFRRDQLVI